MKKHINWWMAGCVPIMLFICCVPMYYLFKSVEVFLLFYCLMTVLVVIKLTITGTWGKYFLIKDEEPHE